ncbi:MAG: hypothetical protein P4L84_32605 [Isosphaeraceae bacterium]|nr:hypothetical protein [Isosphaeraceae bacterium]
MAFDLAGGRRLLLAGGQLGWFWIGAGALALVLLLVLYREERHLVSRRAGLGLLSLRLLAAAVLVFALFEPIAARTLHETLKGRVLVAVDVSESMETADRARPAEDKSRLAATLRLSPGETLDNLPRREVARRLIEGSESPVAKLSREHAVEGYTFARDVARTTLPALAASLQSAPKPDDPALQTTDWRPVLDAALKEEAGGAPILGIVLLTDGRENGPGETAATVDRLAARGVPVFPVLVGATTPPRDAAVAAVKAPEGVYKGDVASIEAVLKLDGYAGREIAVTLERPGASPLRQTVTAPEAGARPVVTFRVPMDEVGTVPLTVAVAPQEGDVRPDNDKRTVSVQVADDKAKVLLVDGEARWEFRYLRNALARDPRVSLDAVVFHQPETPQGSTRNFTYKQALPPRPEADSTQPDPLGGFDAIVIGDVDPADLTSDAWTRLEAYVAERGGTLVVSPGPRYWPGIQGQNELVRKLLPVLDPVLAPIDPKATDPAHPSLPPGVALAPAPAAASDPNAWPMLQLATEPEQNRRLWAGLPWLPWVLTGKAKPAATVLASAHDESAAVLAVQPYGLGKVLWIGTDGTWRWRHRVGDAYHHRFWGQVVRWAASGKLTAGNAYVRFGPLRPRIAEGDNARLQARISEGVAGVGPDLLIAARVFKAGQPQTEAVAVVPLRPVPGQPRTFEAATPALPLGAYVVRLDVPQLAAALHLDEGGRRPEATLEVATRDTSERVELAAARDPLERLASATGGRVLRDDEAATLPSLLRARTKQVTRSVETPLWDSPVMLLLFLAVLTVEWVARKRLGLP